MPLAMRGATLILRREAKNHIAIVSLASLRPADGAVERFPAFHQKSSWLARTSREVTRPLDRFRGKLAGHYETAR
jgi:hypothetical protein